MLHKRLTTPESKIFRGPFRFGRTGVPITIAAIALQHAWHLLFFLASLRPRERHEHELQFFDLWKRVDIQPWLLGSVRKKGSTMGLSWKPEDWHESREMLSYFKLLLYVL